MLPRNAMHKKSHHSLEDDEVGGEIGQNPPLAWEGVLQVPWSKELTHRRTCHVAYDA